MRHPDRLPWTSGNHLQLLRGGGEFFPALITAIDAAQDSVFLETYIFANDVVGQSVIAALCRAAERGVAVNVLVDGFGARHFASHWGDRLAAANVSWLVYRPERTPWRLRRNRLRRLHRKLAVVDCQTAFVGGINIIADDNTPPGLAPRFDFAVSASGPLVLQVRHAALRQWSLVARIGFEAKLRYWRKKHWLDEYRRLRRGLFRAVPLDANDGQARFLSRDNTRHRQTIANAYLEAIAHAQKEVFLAHAYFLPGYRFRHALRDAAARGVRVVLLLQGASDHRLLQYATRALYGSLLAAGIELYEFTGGFLHAKVGVVDGQWATVGSSNIDPFSLTLAHEGNLEIRDEAFAASLRQELFGLLGEHARHTTLLDLKKAGWRSRVSRWLAYGMVRLLAALVGYGKKNAASEGG